MKTQRLEALARTVGADLMQLSGQLGRGGWHMPETHAEMGALRHDLEVLGRQIEFVRLRLRRMSTITRQVATDEWLGKRRVGGKRRSSL